MAGKLCLEAGQPISFNALYNLIKSVYISVDFKKKIIQDINRKHNFFFSTFYQKNTEIILTVSMVIATIFVNCHKGIKQAVYTM